jgi:hypothetical protein
MFLTMMPNLALVLLFSIPASDRDCVGALAKLQAPQRAQLETVTEKATVPLEFSPLLLLAIFLVHFVAPLKLRICSFSYTNLYVHAIHSSKQTRETTKMGDYSNSVDDRTEEIINNYPSKGVSLFV